jgi:hypothetical protein
MSGFTSYHDEPNENDIENQEETQGGTVPVTSGDYNVTFARSLIQIRSGSLSLTLNFRI